MNILAPVKAILVVILLTLAVAASGQIYKWTDEDGRVHYTDTKPPSAEAEELKPKVNTFTHEAVPESSFYVPPEPRRHKTGKSVVMYATEWCGYCKKARKYFADNNIRYTEHDIEKSKKARARYDKFGGSGVPVIFVGDERMNGFSESRFKRLYKSKD